MKKIVMELVCVGTCVGVCVHFRIHCMTMLFLYCHWIPPWCHTESDWGEGTHPPREKIRRLVSYKRKAVRTPFNFYSLFSGIVVWRLLNITRIFLLLSLSEKESVWDQLLNLFSLVKIDWFIWHAINDFFSDNICRGYHEESLNSCALFWLSVLLPFNLSVSVLGHV